MKIRIVHSQTPIILLVLVLTLEFCQANTPFKSCYELQLADPTLNDGVYLIDPDGCGYRPPMNVFCDMTTDGGGWTLIHKNNMSSSADRTDLGFNFEALDSPELNSVGIFDRETIAHIAGENQIFRILAEDSMTFYFSGAPYYTTDHHQSCNYKMGKAQLKWEDQWNDMFPMINSYHAICIAQMGSTSGHMEQEHICLNRFCCGEPNNGFWFNGGSWRNGAYRAGTGWVR